MYLLREIAITSPNYYGIYLILLFRFYVHGIILMYGINVRLKLLIGLIEKILKLKKIGWKCIENNMKKYYGIFSDCYLT